VLFINSSDTESLTGPEAVQQTIDATLARPVLPESTITNLRISENGIILTDQEHRYAIQPLHSGGGGEGRRQEFEGGGDIALSKN